MKFDLTPCMPLCKELILHAMRAHFVLCVQLKENIKAFEITLSPEALQAIEVGGWRALGPCRAMQRLANLCHVKHGLAD